MHGHGHVLVAALTMPAFVRMWSGCQTTKHHTLHPNCLSRGGCEFVHWAAVSALVKHDPSLAPMWCAQAPRWCQRPRPSQSAVPCETLAWQTHSQTLLHSWQGACALCMCAVPSSSSHRFNTSRCCLLACWQASRCCCALCQTCSLTQLGVFTLPVFKHVCGCKHMLAFVHHPTITHTKWPAMLLLAMPPQCTTEKRSRLPARACKLRNCTRVPEASSHCWWSNTAGNGKLLVDCWPSLQPVAKNTRPDGVCALLVFPRQWCQ